MRCSRSRREAHAVQVAESHVFPLSREESDADNQRAERYSRRHRVGGFDKPDNQPGLDDNQRPEPEAFTGKDFAQHGTTGNL